MKKYLIIFSVISINLFAQFGQNRVQYKELDWQYIQTKHFDIFYSEGGEKAAEFAAKAAEDALENIQRHLNYQINNRIALITYNSHNDFTETNTTDSYLGEGIGGFTEPFKNRVVFPFEGSYNKYEHVIHHELVHAVMRDMLYGGTVQNIISKGITLQLPIWVHEGFAEFLSSGWETNSDQFIRNAIINEFLPEINQLDGYFAYRGGQSVLRYIAKKYGVEKIAEILSKIKSANSYEDGLKNAIGLSTEELSERWKKDLKIEYWPDIANRKEPDDFALRLTNNKKTNGFYNTSPAISPNGDKIAFISDRDIFLDVYIMDMKDNEKVKRIVKSGMTNEFEELNVLFPTLTWSPDNKHIALSLKSGGYDVITIINSETEESEELSFKLNGIESVSWSPDGVYLAFTGANSQQSDIYIYNFATKELTNLTDDLFTDSDPTWSTNSKTLFFSSDRKNFLSKNDIPDDFLMSYHNYNQLDLYSIGLDEKRIERLTDWEFSDEKYALTSGNDNEIIFVSDKNGIGNLYKMSLIKSDDTLQTAVPITNSLNEISQPSISKDKKKLVFTSLFKLGYNIFLINNPFDLQPETEQIDSTPYMKEFVEKKGENFILSVSADTTSKESAKELTENNKSTENSFIFTGEYIKDENKDTNIVRSKRIIFGSESLNINKNDTLVAISDEFEDKVDEDGNFVINKYKVNFSPDLIYANAGYSTLYGLLGTTVLSFSDMLGNHRLVGVTSLQIDLKNSDYGLAYYYLGKRINFGVEGFHTARFVYLSRGFGSDLFRFRNYGFVLSASYPLSRFYRLDAGLSYLSVSSENLDNYLEPFRSSHFVIPTMSFIHDNTFWGYYSPIQGVRYNLTFFGNPGISNRKQSFFSTTWDYRNYFRFWYDNSFVFRFSGGISTGANPQRFFIGGTENWINRTFATGEIPLNEPSDFAFLTPALPMRGYRYAEQLGTKYSLMNIELRMPIIRYLLTGALPILFQNILGAAFIDAGSAWDVNKKLQLFAKDEKGNRITKDLLIGTGFGLRSYLLFFLVRFDVAWAYDVKSFSKPKYYFSIGTDF